MNIFPLTDRRVSELKSFPGNVGLYQEAEITTVAENLSLLEQKPPMLVDEDGTVLIGNRTLRAHQQLGTVRVPTVVITGLPFGQKSQLNHFDYYRDPSALEFETVMGVPLSAFAA